MNPESIKSIKEFNLKQMQSNIKLHKIFLSMIIIINIFLFGFTIVYKTKISDIKSKMGTHSLKLQENEKYISSLNNVLSKKLVNIFAKSNIQTGNYHFSFIFDTSEEVKNTQNLISSFSKIKNPYLISRYQCYYDGYEPDKIKYEINFVLYLLVVVKTINGEKFGFFIYNPDYSDYEKYEEDKYYFKTENNNCFLFSLDYNEIYKCNSKGKTTFELNGVGLINIGNEDIIIAQNFSAIEGEINFPFKSFDINENDKGYEMFKNISKHFDIFDVELYQICRDAFR